MAFAKLLYVIVNDPKKTDYMGAELKNIVASHSNIALDEINTVIEYEEMTNSFAFGSMEVLSWLVFLFGVINLINTTLTTFFCSPASASHTMASSVLYRK